MHVVPIWLVLALENPVHVVPVGLVLALENPVHVVLIWPVLALSVLTPCLSGEWVERRG